MLEVHEKKSSQMTDHHGASRNRADQIEGIGSCNGKFAWHPCERNRRRQPGANSCFRVNRSRCHELLSESSPCSRAQWVSITVWSMARIRASTREIEGLRGVPLDSHNYCIMCMLHGQNEECWYTTSTKTRVPRRVEPSGHCRNFAATLSYSNDGLGAARGQRFRKGPCASYPTHHYFPPRNTFLIF